MLWRCIISICAIDFFWYCFLCRCCFHISMHLPKKEAAMTERKSIKHLCTNPWNKEGQYVIETDEFNVLPTADFDDYVLSKEQG